MPTNSTCSAIILAAGQSSRMGCPKQLLELGGRNLINIQIDLAIHVGCNPIIVVLGAYADQIEPLLPNHPDVYSVINPNWQSGMGSSIRLGTLQILQKNKITKSIFLLLSDQPLVTVQYLDLMQAKMQVTKKGIVTSKFEDFLGPPCLFSIHYANNLIEIPDAQGAKQVIAGNSEDVAEVICPLAVYDVDTPVDYQAVKRIFEQNQLNM